MKLSGKVIDQGTGKPIAGVEIWEILPDGRSAYVLGYTDPSGSFDIETENSGSTINFAADEYAALGLPVSQVMISDQVLLARNAFSAKLTFSGVPAWLWIVAAFGFVFILGDGKKIK